MSTNLKFYRNRNSFTFTAPCVSGRSTLWKRGITKTVLTFFKITASVRRERDGEALLGNGDAVAPGDVRDDERLADLQRVGKADTLPVEDALRAHLHAQRGCVRGERET